MQSVQQRTSPWVDKLALVAITVLAAQMHSSGAPERADAAGVAYTVVGVGLGLAIFAIVVVRLFGKRLPYIATDQRAIVAVLVLVAIKVAVARAFLGA